jgi:hypothetical protein
MGVERKGVSALAPWENVHGRIELRELGEQMGGE